jgi:hypothetical protein
MKKQDKVQSQKKRDESANKADRFKSPKKREPLTHNPFADAFKVSGVEPPTQ